MTEAGTDLPSIFQLLERWDTLNHEICTPGTLQVSP